MKRSRAAILVALWAFGGGLGAARGTASEAILRATVKIESPGSTATAFLVARAAGTYLVTAAHVLEQSRGPEATLVLRRRNEAGRPVRFPAKIAIRDGDRPLWTRLDEFDLAALRVELPSEADVAPAPEAWLVDQERLGDQPLEAGEAVRLAGYPHQNESPDSGYPLVRIGCLASWPADLAGDERTLLLAANSFEGDSGGPTWVLRDGADGRPEPRVFAVVSAQMFLDERMRTLYGEELRRHRLALAVVVPSVFVLRLFEQIDAAK